MKNLCSLYKIRITLVFLFGTLLLNYGLLLFPNSGPLNGVIPNLLNADILFGLSFLILFISFILTFSLSKSLKRIIHVCSCIIKGDFEARIVSNERGIMGILSNNINDSIDICDAFVRECHLAVKAVGEKHYFRKIRPEGLQGAFVRSVSGINSIIDSLNTEKITEEKHKKVREIFLKDLNNIIEKAQQGCLDTRMNVELFEGDFRQISTNMNSLMDSVSKPIEDTVFALNALYQGDLTVQIQNDYNGDFSNMKNSLNETTKNLQGIVQNIKKSSEFVSKTSKQISSSSFDLSKRTQTQASNIQEASASIESIVSTLYQSTTTTKEASSKAQLAQEKAIEGEIIVKSVVEAMHAIEKTSNQIATITEAINEIAFQTNILALNAAVEAARAGSHGAGFNVVAKEVRTLANRSAVSAEQIKNFIKSSVNAVNQGVVLANNAGNVLEAIKIYNQDVFGYITDIAKSTDEQFNTIKEVSNAVNQMDQNTQKNAAMVQENTTTSASLSKQAEDLFALVENFQVFQET